MVTCRLLTVRWHFRIHFSFSVQIILSCYFSIPRFVAWRAFYKGRLDFVLVFLSILMHYFRLKYGVVFVLYWFPSILSIGILFSIQSILDHPTQKRIVCLCLVDWGNLRWWQLMVKLDWWWDPFQVDTETGQLQGPIDIWAQVTQQATMLPSKPAFNTLRVNRFCFIFLAS